MTLTFYEYPQLCEMISVIKSSIKVTDPLLSKSRVLHKIIINSKWLEIFDNYDKYVNSSIIDYVLVYLHNRLKEA